MNKDNQIIKYVVYCRKSTDSEDRQVLSLDDQERELAEIEARDNLKVVKRYSGKNGGESQTAHKRGRPLFGEMVGLIEAGKINGLLVWHPNRIARNAYDGGLIITLMDEGRLLEVKTPHRTYQNNPDDKFFLQLEFGMAKKSSDDNGVVVKRGLKTKLEQGWFPGYAPLGYINTKNFEEKGQNKILNDPERFDVVKQAWQMILTGNYSVMEIKRWSDEKNLVTRPSKNNPLVKPISKSTWYKIFANPFYYGHFEYGKPKELYRGSHEPMVTEEEFNRIQTILGKKGRPRSKEQRFAFTGMMRCGNCGAMITAEEKVKNQKNGNSHYYVYYRCTKRLDSKCPEKTVELKNLNSQIDSVIEKLSISEEFKNWAIKYLHEIRKVEASSNESILQTKQQALINITKQLDALFLRFTSHQNGDGQLVSETEYLSHKKALLEKKNTLEGELKNQGKAIEEWIELSEKTFNFARYAKVWFAKGDLQTKKTILACLGSNLVLKDQKLNIELRKSFVPLFESVKVAEKELAAVRTSEVLDNKRQIAVVAANCPTLRRVEDSNL